MKNADDAIERVLAGLRETEAAPGIERRALEGARSRQSVRASRRMVVPVLCGVAMAAMIAAVVVLWTTHRHANALASVVANQTPLKSASPGTPLANDAGLTVHRAEPQRVQWKQSARRSTARMVAVDDTDALALREMRAPSRPAPPMPLTAQEKVLVGIARAPDPQQVAMLDPVLRERQEIAADAEFQRFLNSQQKGESTHEMESQ